jgi:hypothetical protein
MSALTTGGEISVERHPLAVGPAVFGQQLAVGRHQLRGLLGLGLADIADARGEGNQRQHIQQQCQPKAAMQPQSRLCSDSSFSGRRTRRASAERSATQRTERDSKSDMRTV